MHGQNEPIDSDRISFNIFGTILPHVVRYSLSKAADSFCPCLLPAVIQYIDTCTYTHVESKSGTRLLKGVSSLRESYCCALPVALERPIVKQQTIENRGVVSLGGFIEEGVIARDRTGMVWVAVGCATGCANVVVSTCSWIVVLSDGIEKWNEKRSRNLDCLTLRETVFSWIVFSDKT